MSAKQLEKSIKCGIFGNSNNKRDEEAEDMAEEHKIKDFGKSLKERDD
jgi:hypothetical protein